MTDQWPVTQFISFYFHVYYCFLYVKIIHDFYNNVHFIKGDISLPGIKESYLPLYKVSDTTFYYLGEDPTPGSVHDGSGVDKNECALSLQACGMDE